MKNKSKIYRGILLLVVAILTGAFFFVKNRFDEFYAGMQKQAHQESEEISKKMNEKMNEEKNKKAKLSLFIVNQVCDSLFGSLSEGRAEVIYRIDFNDNFLENSRKRDAIYISTNFLKNGNVLKKINTKTESKLVGKSKGRSIYEYDTIIYGDIKLNDKIVLKLEIRDSKDNVIYAKEKSATVSRSYCVSDKEQDTNN